MHTARMYFQNVVCEIKFYKWNMSRSEVCHYWALGFERVAIPPPCSFPLSAREKGVHQFQNNLEGPMLKM